MKKYIIDNQYIIYLFLVILASLVFSFREGSVNLDYDELLYYSNNILLQEPVGVSYASDDMAIYLPRGFEIKQVDNGFVLTNRDASMTIYNGIGVSVNNELISSLNPNYTKLSEVTPTNNNDNNYIGLWEYSQDGYLQLVIIHEDTFISSVFKESQAEKYISESSYVFHSLKEI